MKIYESIDEVKSLIREKESEKARIEQAIAALKIDLADLILAEDEKPKKPASTVFVSVQFKDGAKSYDYIWAGESEIKAGELVEVECPWGGTKHAKVVSVSAEPQSNLSMDRYKRAFPVES